MSMTKDEIINLPHTTKEVQTDFGTITIRSLKSDEIAKLQQMVAIGTITTHLTSEGIEKSRTVDMQEYVESYENMKTTAIMYSLSIEETWTQEEVSRIPVNLCSQLYNEIRILNNLDEITGEPQW